MTTVSDTMFPASQERTPSLGDAVARIRRLLERAVSPEDLSIEHDVDAVPETLQALSERLDLSPFERDVVMLCAACELDSTVPQLCARAQSEPRRTYPTLGLAARALTDADYEAFTPGATLRRLHLIELGPSESLMSAPLRIDERVLHFLCGVNTIDERLASMLTAVSPAAVLPESYREIVERIINTLRVSAAELEWPLIALTGDATSAKPAAAAIACGALGLRLLSVRASQIPAAHADRDSFIRLWQREVVLGNCALFVDADSTDETSIAAITASLPGVVFVSSRESLPSPDRARLTLVVDKPPAEEQRAIWLHTLGSPAASLNGELDAVVADFPLDPMQILRIGSRLAREVEAAPLEARLRAACRIESRRAMGTAARRIPVKATWKDIVLPEFQANTLREIAAHVRHRALVYRQWGFGDRGRCLGVTALFAGPSGTGKTLGAEVLANELDLDLWQIDLSQVVSKYVGETEKNLKIVFDAADEGGAILLFDEADALFGRRSEVHDSHDRLANIEVSYLLSRMESYRGLAILTTNMRNALDPGFLRRIRFILSFPFPDATLRTRIWEHVFPPAVPVEALDVQKLARVNLSGANIHNIALNAAFLAAQAGEPVGMRHLLQSTRNECTKLEKPLTQSEVAGWV